MFPQPTSSVFESAYFKSLLKKWDMLRGTQYLLFRYSKFYHKMQAQELVMDLLNSQAGTFKVLQKDGSWSPLLETVESVQVEMVPATLTRLDVFDKLLSASPPIVRPSGDISKCFDDQKEGFQISDLLRELILNEDSDNAELYSSEEKCEMLWRVFEHVCLGGPCCQFEDKLEPYLDSVKKLYKELLSVHKNTTGALEVASSVYKLTSFTTQSGAVNLFPSTSRNNFCYVTVDPARRVCKVWYHGFSTFW
ncbi:MAG: hypothetical protein WDW38_004061 [Sanguina aurantia]